MSVISELTGFIFTLAGWVIVGAVLSNSYWKVSTVHGSVITSSSIYENLWYSCAEDSIGVSNCRKFDTLLVQFSLKIPLSGSTGISARSLGICEKFACVVSHWSY
uniref:Claudin n=1 Tax=Salvator merianae TaxID=96440 RepID=A0A8D0E923_SALMN